MRRKVHVEVINMETQSYDVVIVGGGAAGLSAALVLGRARRRVAVIDAGSPRNAPAAHMQGYLSRDGMPPAELLAAGRAEVVGYGVELISDTVARIDPGFTIHLGGGRVLTARRILVATGIGDQIPDVPGIRERWGNDLLHCPYCHGWEVRDQPLGVLGTHPGAVLHAQLVRQWSDDVVFFAQADEEAGSEFGMRFIEREFPETLDAEYVINEGGGGTTEVFGVERPVYSIAVAEKGPLWLRLVAEGRPGHGSVPHEDNALDRLVRAMFRIQEWERPLTVAPVLEEYFGRLNRAGVYKGAATVDALKAAAEKDPRIRALLSNTISATTASSGIKHNVIPARAEATLDIRLLPGVKPEDFEAELAAVINDPKVSL